MQQQLIVIPSSGESEDTNAAIQGAGVIDLVTATGDVVVILDGTMHLTMRQGDVKHVDAFKRIRVKGSAQTVTFNIGAASEDSRHGGLVPGGPGTVSPATTTRATALGLNAGQGSSIPVLPIGRTLVSCYISNPVTAAGAVLVGTDTGLGGSVGILLEPGTTSPRLTVADTLDGSGNYWNIRIYNPNATAVTVTALAEYY